MASNKSAHIALVSDGLSAAQARKTMEFWLLSLVFLCIAFVLHGILSHLVPMLLDKGVHTQNSLYQLAGPGLFSTIFPEPFEEVVNATVMKLHGFGLTAGQLH